MSYFMGAPAWPEEPWVRGEGGNQLAIYQDGGLTPLAQVDPMNNLGAEISEAVADRLVDCVNAMSGISDPLAFMERIHILATFDTRIRATIAGDS